LDTDNFPENQEKKRAMKEMHLPITWAQCESIRRALLLILGATWFPASLVTLYYFLDGTLALEDNALLAIIIGAGIFLGWLPTLYLLVETKEEIQSRTSIVWKQPQLPTKEEESR
jgi:hypothetical protein